MQMNMVKLPTKKGNLFLRVAKGHFATSHSHINYYIDVTTQKSRLSEAKAVAQELVAAYRASTIVDTVLCLDGTQVIGTCLANELTKDGFVNMNAHQTIYIVTPEFTSGSQIIFRDNLVPMIANKHVLILAATVTTGYFGMNIIAFGTGAVGERVLHGLTATLIFVVLVLFAVARSKRLSDFLEAIADEKLGAKDKLRAFGHILLPGGRR